MTPASAPYILRLVRVSERGRALFILAVGAFWAWVTRFNAWAGLRGPALRLLRGPDVTAAFLVQYDTRPIGNTKARRRTECHLAG